MTVALVSSGALLRMRVHGVPSSGRELMTHSSVRVKISLRLRVMGS